MGLNLGKAVQAAGAVTYGIAKGSQMADRENREQQQFDMEQEKFGRLKKDWTMQDAATEFENYAASEYAREFGIGQQPQVNQSPAPMQPSNGLGVTPIAPGAPVEMSQAPMTTGALGNNQVQAAQAAYDPKSMMLFGSMRASPETHQRLAAEAAKRGLGKQFAEYIGRAQVAEKENAMPTLEALNRGDIATANQLFAARGQKGTFVPVDGKKGVYALTLEGGKTVEVNPRSMLASLDFKEYVSANERDRKATNEAGELQVKKDELGIKKTVGEAQAKKDEAAARYYDRDRPGKGGAGGLAGEKWDAKQLADFIESNKHIAAVLNMNGEEKPDPFIAGEMGLAVKHAVQLGHEPDSAVAMFRGLRDAAEAKARDKNGDVDAAVFSREYKAGVQDAMKALRLRQSDAPAATEGGSIAKKPADATKKPEAKTQALKHGSPEAKAEEDRLAKIRADRTAKAEKERMDERQKEKDAAAERKIRIEQRSKEADLINGLYKRPQI